VRCLLAQGESTQNVIGEALSRCRGKYGGDDFVFSSPRPIPSDFYDVMLSETGYVVTDPSKMGKPKQIRKEAVDFLSCTLKETTWGDQRATIGALCKNSIMALLTWYRTTSELPPEPYFEAMVGNSLRYFWCHGEKDYEKWRRYVQSLGMPAMSYDQLAREITQRGGLDFVDDDAAFQFEPTILSKPFVAHGGTPDPIDEDDGQVRRVVDYLTVWGPAVEEVVKGADPEAHAAFGKVEDQLYAMRGVPRAPGVADAHILFARTGYEFQKNHGIPSFLVRTACHGSYNFLALFGLPVNVVARCMRLAWYPRPEDANVVQEARMAVSIWALCQDPASVYLAIFHIASVTAHAMKGSVENIDLAAAERVEPVPLVTKGIRKALEFVMPITPQEEETIQCNVRNTFAYGAGIWTKWFLGV